MDPKFNILKSLCLLKLDLLKDYETIKAPCMLKEVKQSKNLFPTFLPLSPICFNYALFPLFQFLAHIVLYEYTVKKNSASFIMMLPPPSLPHTKSVAVRYIEQRRVNQIEAFVSKKVNSCTP